MPAISRRMRQNNAEELYAAIGYGGMTIANCLPKLKEEWQKLKASEEKAGEDLPKVDLSRVHATDGVVVEGFDNTPIKFAKCCSPLPGDPIVGFITRGFGVSIHKQSCANAISSMKDPTNAPRWVKAYWADSVKDSYKAGIEIIALNRSYFEAGCDVVNTNTFGANALKYPDNLREIVEAAVSHAKTARSLAGREEAFVALDIGPTGKLLQPIENGLPIKFTTGLHTGCTKLLVPGDSDIKSIADLKGKKIGVPGLADAATVVSKRSLSAAGIGVTEQNMEVEFSVYSRNDLPQALENGAVDAIALGDPTASIAEEQYGLTALIDTATDPKYKDEYCCNAFVTSKLAAENPKAAAAFTRAVQKASQWVQENPDETAKIIVDKQRCRFLRTDPQDLQLQAFGSGRL